MDNILIKLLNNPNDFNLKESLKNLFGYDLSFMFLSLNESERRRICSFFAELDFVKLISYLDKEEALSLLNSLDISLQKTIIEKLASDDATDIISLMDDQKKNALLRLVNENTSRDITYLLKYEDDQIGAHMTKKFLKVAPLTDVKEATKDLIKKAPDVESINTIFVVESNNKYLGTVTLKSLLKAKSPKTINDLLLETPFVYAVEKLEEAVNKIRDYDLFEIAVLDSNDILVGMLTFDDAIDILESEVKDDFLKLGALPNKKEKNFFSTALHRLPWLIVFLVLSIPIIFVTSSFTALLSTLAILIVFQPLILDSAGDTATQTLAVTLRVLANNDSQVQENSIKEILVGVINGFFIATLAFLMTLLFAKLNPSLVPNSSLGSLSVALVVGVTLWVTVILAPVLGTVIPITLKKLKFDPAVASGPFITTLIDIFSLIIYFGLAVIILGVSI